MRHVTPINLDEIRPLFRAARIRTHIKQLDAGRRKLVIYDDKGKVQGAIEDPLADGLPSQAYHHVLPVIFTDRITLEVGAQIDTATQVARDTVTAHYGELRAVYYGAEYLIPSHSALIEQITALAHDKAVALRTAENARTEKGRRRGELQFVKTAAEMQQVNSLIAAWERIEAQQADEDKRQRFHYSEDRSWRREQQP